MPSRRQFIGAAALVGAGGYIHHRGLRYPRMGFEPEPLPFNSWVDGAKITAKDAFFTASSGPSTLRAVGLEPSIAFTNGASSELRVVISNVSNAAQLKIKAPPTCEVREIVAGTSLQITATGQGDFSLQWFLDYEDGARFAVIGDTGAGLELEWVLQRAVELGAQFLLHLGDFHYVDGEYERAIELFNSAPVPCFVSIGNHDFNDSGLVYDKFLNHIGPLNHAFAFAGVQFINIDTAADFFPAYSGLRGRLLDDIENMATPYSDRVCFTHRNFLDPRPGRDHTIGGVRERPWLADKLKDCGVNHILTGHVHRSAEMEYRGLKQYTVGEGLGFEDIVHEKQVAQLLMGQIIQGQPVQYTWLPLEMPWALHTSPKHEEKLLLEHPPAKLEWYREKVIRV